MATLFDIAGDGPSRADICRAIRTERVTLKRHCDTPESRARTWDRINRLLQLGRDIPKEAPANRAPFELGQGLINRSGAWAWIVKIESAGPNRSRLLIGGPTPMAPICWNVTVCDADGNSSVIDEHTAARLVANAGGRVLPIINPAGLLSKSERLQRERLEQMRADQAARDEAKARVAAELDRIKPKWAQAAIMAELHEDCSDSMSDYWNHRTLRRVVIGWSRHKRDLFAEMRKAAASFPETADLATAPENAEHREKYSMGAGFYLKNGCRDSSGWCVKKERTDWLNSHDIEFAPHILNPGPASPDPDACEAMAPLAAGRFEIQEHTHTKKGFRMWICVLAERVERAEYDQLLSAARALGGWYSKAWAGTPGGFAFKNEAAARQFAGDGGDSGPPAGNDPAGPPIGGMSAAPPISGKPGANMAEKLRALADGMQPTIDDKFRDRLDNTPKRARQAAEARNDGRELERAQAIGRALAAAHEAGTVPNELARVSSKAALVELAKEEMDRSGGYYDAGSPTGRPYQWPDADKTARAAIAWALLERPADPEKENAEALRRKLSDLSFAKIPGYFPTPYSIVTQMIKAAGIREGQSVLEPSAGSGNIADRLAFDHCAAVECVERHASLADILRDKGHNVQQCDFLGFEPLSPFDAVIMNPPFEGGADVRHVRHAFTMLKKGGVLVSIMGAGVSFRQDRLYSEFREWVETNGGEFADIPAGSFKESGTGVASVMLTIRKDF
jgi:predicted RNA methylase